MSSKRDYYRRRKPKAISRERWREILDRCRRMVSLEEFVQANQKKPNNPPRST